MDPTTLYGNISSFGPANGLETVLQTLCELDCSTNLLLDRLKQISYSSRDAAAFLRKRSALENAYARGMMSLVMAADAEVSRGEGKGASWDAALRSSFQLHERIALSRFDLAKGVADAADAMEALSKGNESSRKGLKTMAAKFERHLRDAEAALEKAKHRYDSACEDWERIVLQRGAGEGLPGLQASPSGPLPGVKRTNPLGLFKQAKTPTQLSRMEEDAKHKAGAANDDYKRQLDETNKARQTYYSCTLPKLLRTLMMCVSEAEAGMQYLMAKYAFTYENAEFSTASTIIPSGGKGLRYTIDQISNEKDFSSFLAVYQARAKHQETKDIPYTEYAMSATAQSLTNPKPVFGVDLVVQSERDGHPIPPIISKCVEAIEEHGMDSQGIYRLSGQTSRIRALRALFDRDADLVNLAQGDWLLDINVITGLLKLYFRELPERLLTNALYPEFIRAAILPSEESGREMRSLVHRLPPVNYAVVKYLFSHLGRVVARSGENMMNARNIGIVFGPTLMVGADEGKDPLADMGPRSKTVERILEYAEYIFTSV